MAGIAQREFDRYFAMQADSSWWPSPVFALPPPIMKLTNFNVCDENAAAVLDMVRRCRCRRRRPLLSIHPYRSLA